MSWPGKLLVTYENFTSDLPALEIGKRTKGCHSFCQCKCKCCGGVREKYVAFDGENVIDSEFSNEFSGDDDVQKIMRFRSSDMLVLLQVAQLRDHFWTNQYFKVDLQEDYEAIAKALELQNRKFDLKRLAEILETVTSGYRRAVSQLSGQESQGALRPKMRALVLPGLRCDCIKCEQLPWKKLQDVEDHQRSHTYSDNFHCQICYRRFYLQHSLTSYFSRNVGPKNFGTEELQENLRYKRILKSLKSREREQTELRYAKIEDIVMPVYKDLKMYLREETGPSLQKRKTTRHTKCPICNEKYGFSFSHQLHMVKHRRDCDDITLYPCSYCNRSFRSRKFLSKHHKRVRMSSNIRYRPFKCQDCPSRFQLWSVLKTHITRIHERKKPCLICQLPTLGRCCFNHTVEECREAVKKHREKLRRINGPPKAGCKKKPRPVCEICGMDFANKFFLREHLNKKHLHRRNFTCEMCGARFFSQGTMQTHRKSVHLLIQTAECDVCNLTIKSRANFLRHCKSKRHKKELLKLNGDQEKHKESNQNESVAINQTESSNSSSDPIEEYLDMLLNNESTTASEDIEPEPEIYSRTPSRFQIPEKVTFCKPCGNSIVGNMQRHFRSTKHRRNLVASKKNNKS
ncbi:zinc finger protein 595 [Drosophila ficusphila]|uniref:zinc finger protein 595 n=1 Tax=Drosophila ficusphila TaxID=30025 RepID=UPI0007E5C030|nr:zinc finger protein 595 [Drosophila ficusphila]